jgi:hypothetical protein
MIQIHRDNRVIFWLLIGGLVMNILWSLRLELQAQTTTNADNYDFSIDLSDGRGPFYIKMGRNQQYFNVRYHDCGLLIGHGKGEGKVGVALGKDHVGKLWIVEDKGVLLEGQKVVDIIAYGEMNIRADGDINIRSKNGVVKINGQKIQMNK